MLRAAPAARVRHCARSLCSCCTSLFFQATAAFAATVPTAADCSHADFHGPLVTGHQEMHDAALLLLRFR